MVASISLSPAQRPCAVNQARLWGSHLPLQVSRNIPPGPIERSPSRELQWVCCFPLTASQGWLRAPVFSRPFLLAPQGAALLHHPGIHRFIQLRSRQKFHVLEQHFPKHPQNASFIKAQHVLAKQEFWVVAYLSTMSINVSKSPRILE